MELREKNHDAIMVVEHFLDQREDYSNRHVLHYCPRNCFNDVETRTYGLNSAALYD